MCWIDGNDGAIAYRFRMFSSDFGRLMLVAMWVGVWLIGKIMPG